MSRRAIKRYEEVLKSDKAQEKDAALSECGAGGYEVEQTETYRQVSSQSLFALLASDGACDDGDDTDENDKLESSYGIEDEKSADADLDAQNVKAETFLVSGTDEDQSGDVVNNPENGSENGSENGLVKEHTAKKKKKKKKRRGKKQQNYAANHETDPDWIALNAVDPGSTSTEQSYKPGWIPSSYFSKDDDDETRAEAIQIMTAIEHMISAEKLEGEHATDNGGASLIHIETRLLNADSELKKLFGSHVINSERRLENATSSSTARRWRRTGTRSHLRRRVSLVSPRENWFAEAPGLVMVLDPDATSNAAPGLRYFRYVYEASYARLQNEYRVLVGTHDPNMLAGFASKHPFHVDTLLQLAEVYRQMGELDMAAEQIERCLYVLENSWNLAFKPFDGTCRLSFDVLENRSLFVALFRYSQLLTRRGLHRTALEISKLLLNFDPERDPMGMLMLADSFALLSGEYQWVLDMCDNFSYIPMRYFPNFAASTAIAHESMRLGISGISTRGAIPKAKNSTEKKSDGIHEDSGQITENALVDALLTFPMLLKPLLAAVEDTSGVWMEHRLFDEAWYGEGYVDFGVLLRMSRVYAERSKLLWNSTSNKQLLVRCARIAGELDTAAGAGVDPVSGRTSSAYVRDAVNHERVALCRARRAEAGEWLRNSGLYRDVQIADFSDSTTNLPAEVLAGDGADQAIGATAPRSVTLAESAVEFLQSLLPWREAGDA